MEALHRRTSQSWRGFVGGTTSGGELGGASRCAAGAGLSLQMRRGDGRLWAALEVEGGAWAGLLRLKSSGPSFPSDEGRRFLLSCAKPLNKIRVLSCIKTDIPKVVALHDSLTDNLQPGLPSGEPCICVLDINPAMRWCIDCWDLWVLEVAEENHCSRVVGSGSTSGLAQPELLLSCENVPESQFTKGLFIGVPSKAAKTNLRSKGNKS